MTVLYILKGPNEGSVIPLDRDRMVIGRNSDCDIVVPLTALSRHHAVILRISGKYFIEDNQSRNGTYVNNQVISTRTALKNNDRIRLCDFLACFMAQGPGRGGEYVTRTKTHIRAVQPLALAGGVNTPDYLSPQQINEPPEGAVKSVPDDLHAVAVMAFQMLTGRLPFPTTGSVVARLEAIVEGRFDSAVDVCRVLEIGSALAPQIDRALAGEYPSATKWLGQLRRGPAAPKARPAAITRGEGFNVTRLLFEDVVSEAFEAIGERSGTRVTLRLFKPRFISDGFLQVLAELPVTGHDPAPETFPGILHRFLAGRASPLPVKAGSRVEIDPNLAGAGCPCLVEEYVGNQTLQDVIRSGATRGDDRRVESFLVQLLETLAYAHSLNCVHGNLTPYCIFVHDNHLKVEGFGLHTELEKYWMESDDESNDRPSTVDSRRNDSAGMLEAQPADKLRHLIEITNNLSRTLELQTLLPKIADSLFSLFRQADRCFLIVQGEGDRLQPRLVKTRRAADESNARFSKSIVRKALETVQAFLSDDASRDDRIQLSQSVVDFRIRSVMCAPLCRADGKAFAVIQLDTQDRSKKFSQDDLKLLCAVANQAAISLENARMLDETVQQEKAKRDLELGRAIVECLLPDVLPDLPGYELYGYMEAANQVGGDYYGFIPLPDGRLVVVVADVAGKGVPAALIMAKLSGVIPFCVLYEKDPEAAVASLNAQLVKLTTRTDRFVTLTAVYLDPGTHVATACLAGHPPPKLYRSAAGEVMCTSGGNDFGGPPLGLVEGLTFDSRQVTLQPGDCLVLYTDGVNESRNIKQECFPHTGVEQAIRSAGNAGPKVVGEKLVAAVKLHAAGRDHADDFTVVVIGRKEDSR